MNTHMLVFHSFSRIFHNFVLAKLATSSIRVKKDCRSTKSRSFDSGYKLTCLSAVPKGAWLLRQFFCRVLEIFGGEMLKTNNSSSNILQIQA